MRQNKSNQMPQAKTKLCQSVLMMAALGVLAACQATTQSITELDLSGQTGEADAQGVLITQTDQIDAATTQLPVIQTDDISDSKVDAEASAPETLDLKADEIEIAAATQAEAIIKIMPEPKLEPKPEPKPEPKIVAKAAPKPTPKQAPKPAPKPQIIPASLVGQSGVELLSHLGSPDFTRYEMQVHIWQYRLPSCVVDFFFYPLDADKAIVIRNTPSSLKDSVKGLIITNSHIRARLVGRPYEATACYQELAQRK